MKRSIKRQSLLLLLLLALALASVGGSSTAAQVTRAPCPLICSTPEIYGFTQGGAGLCKCASALPGGAYYLQGADNCFCYMCFAPQQDGTVLGLFYKDDGTCMEGSVDCKDSTVITSQPTAAPAVSSSSTSSPPPASASSSSTSSTSKSSGWSSIATGVLTFLCVLVLGMAMVTATTVHRKNTRTRLNRVDGGGDDDIVYRAQGSSNGDSVYFEVPAATVVAPATIAVRSHIVGEAPPVQTYEVLVFGVDSSTEYQQQPQ